MIYKIIVNDYYESDALLIRVEDVYHTAYLSNDDDGTWVYDKDHNEVSPTLGDRGLPEGTRIVVEDENGEIEADGRRFREITDEVFFDDPTIDVQHGINTEQIVFDSEFGEITLCLTSKASRNWTTSRRIIPTRGLSRNIG